MNRGFYVTIEGFEPRLMLAKSRSAARYDRYLEVADLWPMTFGEFLRKVSVHAARLPPAPPRHPAMTDDMRSHARHALGLPNSNHRSYRNRYVTAAAGPDGHLWEAMVGHGLAGKQQASEVPFGGNDLYWLTRLGAESALDQGEGLCPEDFPKRDLGAAA